MKTLFALLLIIITVKVTLAQDVQKIDWNVDRPLTWSDFQAPVDESSKFSAFTFYGEDFNYKWHQVNGEYTFVFNVRSFMSKDKSWTVPDKQTPNLLKHEQIHFDISEFFARQLLIAFNKYTFTNNYKAEISQIHQAISDQRKAMEELYDEQTNHSLNKLLQAKWEIYVADLLANDYQLNEALSKAPGK